MWCRVKEKRNVMEFHLRTVSAKKHKEIKRACISFIFIKKNIFCLFFISVAKLSSRKKVIFKVSFFWRYSKTLKNVCLQRKKICSHRKRFAYIHKTNSRQKATANSWGKFPRQKATANGCGKISRQIVVANFHVIFPWQITNANIYKRCPNHVVFTMYSKKKFHVLFLTYVKQM